jgi:hypothetical protein
MGRDKRLLLCFHVEGGPHRELALDYWAGRLDGQRWVWDKTVLEVATKHGVDKRNVLDIVQAEVTAVDMTQRCMTRDCGAPKLVSSRTSLTEPSHGSYLNGRYICSDCLRSKLETEASQRQEKDRLITTRQSDVLTQQADPSQRMNFYELSYSEIVIAYGILQCSDEACESGEFFARDLYLCPSNKLTQNLLSRLFDCGFLQFSAQTPLNAIVIHDDDSWAYYPDRVKWRVVSDASGLTCPRLMSALGEVIDARDDMVGYVESVTELWELLAFDDTMQFLQRQTDDYRLRSFKAGPKTEESIRYALERFSIPQVRRVIKSVVEKAAALSVNRNFVPAHAANTIPGNIISYVDRALSEAWTVYPLLKDWTTDEPILTTLLFNRVLGVGLPGFKSLSGSGLRDKLSHFSAIS